MGDVLLVCNEVPVHVVKEALVCGRAAGATTILNPAPAIGISRSIFGLADIVTPNRTELATLLLTEARRVGRKTDSANGDTAVRARALMEAGSEGPGVRKAAIVTLGASGVVVLERVGSGLSAVVPPAPEPVDPCADADQPADGNQPAGADSADHHGRAADHHVRAAGRSQASRGSDLRVWEVQADLVDTIDSTGAGDAFCGALAAALAEGRPLAVAVQRAVAAGALATTHVGAREGMPTAVELENFLAARQAV
jgi:sugar/nucleoside kinase (ribokinase family)